jgi:kinesin family member 1
VDWTFAKREAAFARLGLDPTLDNLPDEDLNKLFDKITKVKSLRGHGGHRSVSRPDSSLSHVEDIWSESGRPFSSDATDDSSWDAVQSRGSPMMDGSLKDVQNQLESRLQAITESSTEAEDLKVEKDHMQHQLKLVQKQMRRLIDARARGDTDVELTHFEPVIYSARQLRLIRKVLDKWRAHRSFSMAEVVLSNAVLIKEANVIRFVLLIQYFSIAAEDQQQRTRKGCFLQLHCCVRRLVGRAIFCSGHHCRT